MGKPVDHLKMVKRLSRAANSFCSFPMNERFYETQNLVVHLTMIIQHPSEAANDNLKNKEVTTIARRSKPLITQFFNRDRVAFTALSRVGHASHFHLRDCGLADARIKNLVRDGYVEKVAYTQGKEVLDCYKLTKKGRELSQ
ncbi:hypothetical protein J2T20_001904 [Paenibacillus wynnii]|nr:hypothetical protein [Paenibacillus wynnii]